MSEYNIYKMLNQIKSETPTMGGIPVPYIPHNSCWTNPLDEYKDSRKKSTALTRAIDNNEMAVDEHGKLQPVERSFSKFAFVGGMWRVQVNFPYEITRVRDKDMVLTEKLDHTETTLFEFYRAKLLNYNCYGPFVVADNKYDYIVAKYITDDKTYWAYGKTIEQARAFMGIKMYDEYKDVINTIACKKKLWGK